MTKEQKLLGHYLQQLLNKASAPSFLTVSEDMARLLCGKDTYDQFQQLLGDAYDSVHDNGPKASGAFPVASHHYHLVFTAQTEIILSTPNGSLRLTVEPK